MGLTSHKFKLESRKKSEELNRLLLDLTSPKPKICLSGMSQKGNGYIEIIVVKKMRE